MTKTAVGKLDQSILLPFETTPPGGLNVVKRRQAKHRCDKGGGGGGGGGAREGLGVG